MRVWGNQFGAAPYPVQMRPVRPDILSKKSSADMPEMSRRSATGDCRINQELGPVIMVEILTGANQGGCTNWNDRKDNPQFSICKCGARRIDSQLGLESTPEEY